MELQEGDDLALLAAHLLEELAFAAIAKSSTAASTTSTPSLSTASAGDVQFSALLTARSLLLEAAFLLDVCGERSANNPRVRYAAMRVYGFLGCNASIIAHNGSPAFMRLKYIARDTLNHASVPHYTRLVWLEALKNAVDDELGVHRDMKGQHNYHTQTALDKGHYSNALDIIRLQTRMAESGTLAQARSLLGLLQLEHVGRNFTEATNTLRRIVVTGEVNEAVVDTSIAALLRLRDNDDRDVYVTWDTPSIPVLHEARHGLHIPGLTDPFPASTGVPVPVPGAGVSVPAESGVWLVNRFANAASELTASILRANGVESPASGSSPAALTAPLYAFLGPLATGANGGSYERLLRRVARDSSLVARNAVMRAVIGAADENVESATGAASELIALFAQAGLLGSSEGGDGLVAAVRARLCGEYSSNCVPIVDTALSNERSHVRSGCAQLLVTVVKAAQLVASARAAASAATAAAAAAKGKEGGKATGKKATGTGKEEVKAIADAPAATTTTEPVTPTGGAGASATASAPAVESPWALAAKQLASANALLSSLSSDIAAQRLYTLNPATGDYSPAPASALASTSTGKAATGGGAAAGGAAKGGKASAAGAEVTQPVNPSTLAELTLLGQHTLLYAVIATHYVVRSTAAAKTAAEAKAAKKASTAAATAAQAAGASSTGRAAEELASISSTAEAAGAFLGSVKRSLAGLESDLHTIKKALEVNVEKATPLIIGGFKAEACVTSAVKSWMGEFAYKQANKGTYDKEKANAAATALTAAAAKGPGHVFVAEALDAQVKAMRKKVEDVVVHIGASYTNSVEKVRDEVLHRQAFLKDVSA